MELMVTPPFSCILILVIYVCPAMVYIYVSSKGI